MKNTTLIINKPQKGYIKYIPNKILNENVNEILIPTFEVSVNPKITLSIIQKQRFYLVDKNQTKAKEILKQEINNEMDAIFVKS